MEKRELRKGDFVKDFEDDIAIIVKLMDDTVKLRYIIMSGRNCSNGNHIGTLSYLSVRSIIPENQKDKLRDIIVAQSL